MRMFFLIGMAVFAFGFYFMIATLGGEISDFIHVWDFMVIIIPLLGILIGTQNFEALRSGVKALIFPKAPIPYEMRLQAADLFRFFTKTTALLMGAVLLIHIVCITLRLDFSDREMTFYNYFNLVTSSSTFLLGIYLIAAVFEPAVYILRRRKDSDIEGPHSAS